MKTAKEYEEILQRFTKLEISANDFFAAHQRDIEYIKDYVDACIFYEMPSNFLLIQLCAAYNLGYKAREDDDNLSHIKGLDDLDLSLGNGEE